DITTKSYEGDSIALDIYSDDGFVYLPTKDNGSKVEMKEIPGITAMPPTMKLVIQQLQKKTTRTETYNPSAQSAACLAPLLTQFVGSRGEFMPSLFKVITPRSFRTVEQYQKLGYLHPSQVPEGQGSNYLTRLSAILGADESVDHELYMDTMTYVNGLFDDPMEDKRLDKTILDPMIEGRASVEGKPIWQYNEHWAKKRYTITTKHGLIIDLGFDDQRNMYYYMDMTNEELRGFTKDNDFISYLDVTSSNVMPKKPIFKKKLPIVRIASKPAEPFGFCQSDTPQVLSFNSFKRTAALTILHNPEDYAKFYSYPATLMKYLETLVPNQEAREYMIQFLKRKLTYFEYSPVSFYLLGKPGSGKDTLVSILEKIITAVSRPTTDEFLEVYNKYMLDTYFVQLDEYGDQITKMIDREAVKGKWKAYTGKKEMSLRVMRTDGIPYNHNVTFIFTANKNPIVLDDNDRRVHLMDTPNILSLQPWFSAEAHDKIMEEVKDFCYYLATEVPLMSKTEYMTAPKSADKNVLIADSMFAAQKISYAINHCMHDYLIELAIDNNVPALAREVEKGRITSHSLEQLYDELTDFKGDVKTIMKILRKSGVKAIPTTHDGIKSYYISLETANPFGEETNE
ncbi:MAG: hypothetical protein KUG81_03485, partial [Gammaproteobacteria bacterium]|nr:hypothetical protein [Gammaproteobacteria bacterium]